MLIIDGDYPMAYGAVDLDRDLTRPIEEIRSATGRRSLIDGWPDEETMASLPEMRKGRIAAALVKIVARIRRPQSTIWGYRTGHGAYRRRAGAAGVLSRARIGRRGAHPDHRQSARGPRAGMGGGG